LGEWIGVCSNEADCSFQRAGTCNNKRVKIHLEFKTKIFFYRTSKPKLIKPCTYNPWVKGIQVCLNRGSGPFQRGDNRKNGVGSFKNLKILILKNYEARKP
jgi:hypothetical protein